MSGSPPASPIWSLAATKNPVMNSADELAHANRPNIRLFHIEKRSADYPMDD